MVSSPPCLVGTVKRAGGDDDDAGQVDTSLTDALFILVDKGADADGQSLRALPRLLLGLWV